jgi:hypothetical protein
MNAAAVNRFASIAARVRAHIWPCTVTVAGGIAVAVAKSGSKPTRTPAEMGTGYVERTLATFNFKATGNFVPSIGAEWTIASAEQADEVGTRWRCFQLVRSAAGFEHVATCFRLDT